MNRITDRDLESIAARINYVTGSPQEPYTRTETGYTANIGCYHISGAYGGVSLHRLDNQAGGVVDVFRCGHIPKRDLYNRMMAMLEGLAIK